MLLLFADGMWACVLNNLSVVIALLEGMIFLNQFSGVDDFLLVSDTPSFAVKFFPEFQNLSR